MITCKNCGANEFKDGKCAYCGTDYGLTGDGIQDKWLLALKRKRIMAEDGWSFGIDKEGDIFYAVKNNGTDRINTLLTADYAECIKDIFMFYIENKYKKQILE